MVDVGRTRSRVRRPPPLLAASSPAGPAFEGAQISAGQRRPGAIERVRIEPRSSRGSRSSAPSRGRRRERRARTGSARLGHRRGDRRAVPRRGDHRRIVDGRLGERTARISPTDARSRTSSTTVSHDRHHPERRPGVQLAALYAGVRLLMDHAGSSPSPTSAGRRLRSQIDTTHAMILGLILDRDPTTFDRPAMRLARGRSSRSQPARPTEIESVVRRVGRSDAVSLASRSTSSRRWRFGIKTARFSTSRGSRPAGSEQRRHRRVDGRSGRRRPRPVASTVGTEEP